jgi:hypothetical protein
VGPALDRALCSDAGRAAGNTEPAQQGNADDTRDLKNSRAEENEGAAGHAFDRRTRLGAEPLRSRSILWKHPLHWAKGPSKSNKGVMRHEDQTQNRLAGHAGDRRRRCR